MRRLIKLAICIAAVSLTALGQLIITTGSLPDGVLGQPYTPVVLQTSGAIGPVVWSIIAGSTPSGFVVGGASVGQLNTTGTFCFGVGTQSGPPGCLNANVQSFPGQYTFTLQADDLPSGQITTRDLTINVVQPLQITTPALPDALANQLYSFQLQTLGGSGEFAWSITGGALPPGIFLDPTTGRLAGTAPNSTALYTFTVQVLDQASLVSVAKQFSINVQGGLAITTTVLPDATVNQTYSFQLTAVGGIAYVWSVPPGSQLPPGFNLSAGGLLTGFGLGTGTFKFVIAVTDPQTPNSLASRTFSFNITLGTLQIVETTIPSTFQNAAYRATLHPSGGIPPYRWGFDISNPQNLSIGTTTGTITGTPPNAGTFGIPVTLRDSIGGVFSQTFSLTVFPAVSITTTSLPGGTPGVPYGATLAATGGSLPYTWTVSSGSPPPGLTLSASGQITGTPTVQGASQFTVQVSDFSGGIATKVFTITIGAGQALSITTASLPNGTLNQPYSQTLAAAGGTQPYTWSVASGSLPPGLQLNPATGAIAGTPTSTGNFGFDIVVNDAVQGVARKSFSINVVNAGNPVVITSSNFIGTVLAAFSQTLAATGGTPPYTWSASGNLPSGLQLNTSTGAISGTPSAPGTNQVTFTATDANNQTGSKTIGITIVLPTPPSTTISVGSNTQPTVGLSTSASYPVDITGVLTLTFTSSIGSPDGGEARFSNGTRSLSFTVPANTTQATFSGGSNPAVVTGTVAGTIAITASMSAGGQDITPSPAPTQTIPIAAAVPVITSVTLQQVTGGVNVVVSGYSNTREVSSGSFTFSVSSGNTLSQATITVTLTSAYAAWFGSAASNPTGGQFKLTAPFSVTQGSATAVTKVSVTLTNGKGVSGPGTSP